MWQNIQVIFTFMSTHFLDTNIQSINCIWVKKNTVHTTHAHPTYHTLDLPHSHFCLKVLSDFQKCIIYDPVCVGVCACVRVSLRIRIRIGTSQEPFQAIVATGESAAPTIQPDKTLFKKTT